MKIIVIGSGTVGTGICARLASEGHDITVVDILAEPVSEIESLHRVMGDQAEALEFVIKQEIDSLTHIPLKDLKPRKGVLIACLIRGDKRIIPTGEDALRKGDAVIVITAADKQINNIKDILKQ